MVCEREHRRLTSRGVSTREGVCAHQNPARLTHSMTCGCLRAVDRTHGQNDVDERQEDSDRNDDELERCTALIRTQKLHVCSTTARPVTVMGTGPNNPMSGRSAVTCISTIGVP